MTKILRRSSRQTPCRQHGLVILLTYNVDLKYVCTGVGSILEGFRGSRAPNHVVEMEIESERRLFAQPCSPVLCSLPSQRRGFRI